MNEHCNKTKYELSGVIAIISGFLLMLVIPVSAQEIMITNTHGLAFGSFAAGSGGTVTVSSNNLRSAGGDVFLFPSGQVTAAGFTISGAPNASYNIDLPPNEFVKLTGPGGEMSVNNFSSSPSITGLLSAGGSQTLTVGATLVVGSNQAPGEYTGSFSVIVNYN